MRMRLWTLYYSSLFAYTRHIFPGSILFVGKSYQEKYASDSDIMRFKMGKLFA